MKQLLVLLFLLCSASVFAQDVIVKKDGSTIVCRVVEVTSTEIVYKKWSDLNGSNYVMERSAASAINYENGKKVDLSEATNLYTSNNQNDGTRQYNDNALIALDYAASNPLRKAKNLRLLGWIGGSALLVGAFFLAEMDNESGFQNDDYLSFAAIGAGITCTTVCLISANKIKKNFNIQNYSLLNKNLKFANGSSLSTGIDMLRDNTLGQNTLGFGLRYNF